MLLLQNDLGKKEVQAFLNISISRENRYTRRLLTPVFVIA